jgi:hypothetical protein
MTLAALLTNIFAVTFLCIELWAFAGLTLEELPPYVAFGVIVGAVLTGL